MRLFDLLESLYGNTVVKFLVDGELAHYGTANSLWHYFNVRSYEVNNIASDGVIIIDAERINIPDYGEFKHLYSKINSSTEVEIILDDGEKTDTVYTGEIDGFHKDSEKYLDHRVSQINCGLDGEISIILYKKEMRHIEDES